MAVARKGLIKNFVGIRHDKEFHGFIRFSYSSIKGAACVGFMLRIKG